MTTVFFFNTEHVTFADHKLIYIFQSTPSHYLQYPSSSWFISFFMSSHFGCFYQAPLPDLPSLSAEIFKLPSCKGSITIHLLTVVVFSFFIHPLDPYPTRGGKEDMSSSRRNSVLLALFTLYIRTAIVKEERKKNSKTK